MYVFLGQIGLGDLAEEEKQDFIAFVNGKLKDEAAGAIKPVKSHEIVKNGLPPVIGDAADLMQIAGFVYVGAKITHKKLPYFYDLAMLWLQSKKKGTYHMEQVKKMLEFTQEGADSNEDGEKQDAAKS